MENISGINNENAVENLKKLWLLYEEKFGIHLTLHDHCGWLLMPDGKHILPGLNIHNSPCCSFYQSNRRKCMEHCKFKVEELSAATRQPFIMKCWRGITEIVLPLYVKQIHVMTIYAGCFQTPEMDMSKFSAKYMRLYNQMPLLTEKMKEEYSLLLASIGSAILQIAEQLRSQYDNLTGRQGAIRKYIANNYTDDIGAEDLAEHLGLSVSRTLHLIKLHFGTGFAAMLANERIYRAKILLAETNLSLRKIAELTGFKNEYYFSTVFKKNTRRAPGWYKKHSVNTNAHDSEHDLEHQ